MKQCVHIQFAAPPKEEFLQKYVQKKARELVLEGTAQMSGSERVSITVCGSKDNVDLFIDFLHQASYVTDVEIEPFLKSRDYRGVFRVIE